MEDIVALAVSGHSLGVTPVGYDGSLLAEYVPCLLYTSYLYMATPASELGRKAMEGLEPFYQM